MFRCGEDDWDLQAVVRGCSTVSVAATSTNTAINHPLSSFPPLNIEDDPLTRFQSLLETTDALEELEQLYKPFVPKQRPLPPQSISKSPLSVLGGFTEQQQQLQQRRTQQQSQKQQPQRCLTGSAPASSTQAQTPRSKRRKNQQKKVVCQVPAEGLSSDMWAWRKYGQKPIKGSPYPRGYYRCSSSKGCLARKQVERSRSDPAMFVITYTAEHNHPVPTHRNSLAGSTRNKSSTPRADTAGDPGTPTSKRSYPSSPNSTADLSPTTPSTTSMEDEHLHRTKQESKEEEEETVAEDEEDDELLIPDVVMTDDLFMTLEELSGATSGFSATTTTTSPANGQAFDHCFPDHFGTTLPHPWFSNNAATAGGGS